MATEKNPVSESDNDWMDPSDQVQVSADGTTVWVHSLDGCTVGRFSKIFGMDVHTGMEQQLAGGHQCLHCTHEPAGMAEWREFCSLMQEHHGIVVDLQLLQFEVKR